MKIDFSKLKNTDSVDTVINPKDLFNILPNKNEKFSYLRDIQAEVIEKWFNQKESKDNIIKMNTGSGKTIVGLLILKTSLNEGYGPAVYIVPDNFLLKQVIEESKNLGIEVTDDPDSTRFIRNKSILIINIHKLFNGKSVFGVGSEGIKKEIKTLLIDDAHACIDKIEEQFTLSISNNKSIYQELFELFKGDLMIQSESITFDIENSTPYTNMLLPFWSLQNKITDVFRIINKIENDDDIKFHYPLLKKYLHLCDCVISSEAIEFSSRVIPINIINSYSNVKRRIIMSATLPDDSMLLTHLGIDKKEIERSITPSSASDIGERMIIVPQELNVKIQKQEIKDLLLKFSLTYNVVIIVPSFYRSKYWSDVAYKIVSSENIEESITELKTKHCGIMVLVNKYDGIDLPKEACRILVIDELPDERREIDKIDANLLSNNKIMLRKKIQKIEQGMGRGIRSNEDYCAVLLLGDSLINQLYTNDAINLFTPATKAQIELSEKLTEQIRNQNINSIEEVILTLLNRNSDWVSANKSALLHTKYIAGNINNLANPLKDAYNIAEIKDYKAACKFLQDSVNIISNDSEKGFLRYYLALFTNFSNQIDSQLIMKNAIQENRKLPIPLEGISYIKLETIKTTQARQCSDFINSLKGNKNNLIITLNSILSDLVFIPDTSNRFEEAIKKIAFFIGFTAQRPENEFKKGPDDIWLMGELEYLVIECKNGCETDYIKKHDCNQINGSINWFRREYDSTCKCFPVLIHPTNLFHYSCSPHKDIKIMNNDKLNILKENIRNFIVALTSDSILGDIDKIANLLIHHKLSKDNFLKTYFIDFSISSK
jgi:hypothetical protein